VRHHFHRCSHLRVVSADASDLRGGQRGGGIILEELCDAKNWTPCVGLVECDVLPLVQRRHLLTARATQMRDREGGPGDLSGVPRELSARTDELRCRLVEERQRIVSENERIRAELAQALDLHGSSGAPDEYELLREGISLRLDYELDRLRVQRLDAIDRALDAMASPTYGVCALCRAPIAVQRLRDYPETSVCSGCAREASSRR
jgi:RNA polymerase-binding transcription factor DksA